MKIVVIIPALNESATITNVIRRIPSHIPGIETISVVVIDDGSTDETAAKAVQAGAAVVRHFHNQGVGAAFHSGIEAALQAGADIIVNMDADGQFDPEDIPKLLAPILAGKAEFVTASRFARPDFMPDMPAIKRWGNQQMVRIVNFLTGKKFTDVSCGFRAFTRETALRLTLFGRFTYTQETFLDLAHKNIAVTEVPLKIRGEREFGQSRVASNLWKFGFKAASIIFRTARDYHSFIFFGIPGLLVLLGGLGTGIFLLVHYLRTAQTAPFRSLVQVSGVLIIVGILLLFLAMLADMQHRNRILIEQQLYLTRKHVYGKK